MKTFYINGAQIRSLHSFGKVLRDTFFLEEHLNLKSLDVINDVLHGGFGLINTNEPIKIVWQKHQSSQRKLDTELYQDILKLFRDNPNIALELE